MGTSKAAQGRWREILLELGVPLNFLNGKHQACPIPGCGGKDRARFTDRNGEGKYICGQCGPGDGFELLKKFHGWTYKQAADAIDKIIGNLPEPKPRAEPPRAVDYKDMLHMWQGVRPIRDEGPAAKYLIGRGISMAAWPKALRFAWWQHKPTEQKLPCMVALFRTAQGEPGTLHRTYLANVKPRRMFLPGGLPKGGAIRLFDADLCMGIAEGIETALSAALLFRMPVWATTSELMLRAWQPPPGAKRITIFGDYDRFVGQRAAYELAWRLSREDFHVTVEIPPTPDWDWNDVLKNEIETERYPNLPPLRSHHRGERPAGESIRTA
jgi:putative DNA primase/helicase